MKFRKFLVNLKILIEKIFLVKSHKSSTTVTQKLIYMSQNYAQVVNCSVLNTFNM